MRPCTEGICTSGSGDWGSNCRSCRNTEDAGASLGSGAGEELVPVRLAIAILFGGVGMLGLDGGHRQGLPDVGGVVHICVGAQVRGADGSGTALIREDVAAHGRVASGAADAKGLGGGWGRRSPRAVTARH